MNGIIIVNKEKDMTSRDVVNILCKFFNTKKIGHTGTLDPIATGVLIITIGKCTKLNELLTSEYKEYIATMKLGILTDTLDITGKIIDKKNYNINKENLIKVLKSFVGKSTQEVPLYSAVKVNGKKLYQYAFNNESVILPKKEIDIKEIELLEIKEDIIKFRCVVSKGTYIRSLIRDIGIKLNTYGTMIDLIRTKQGSYNLEDSYSIHDILNNNYKLITLKEILKDYEKIECNEELFFKIKNGAVVDKEFTSKYCVYIYNGEVISIYKEYEKDNNKAKPYIMFI